MNPISSTPDNAQAAPKLRDATVHDGSDLAILADAATRRLVSWLWDESASDGQSNFEIGRTTILANQSSPSYLANWAVAEVEGRVAGALNSYRLAPADRSVSGRSAQVVRPLFELKSRAEGTWYISVASVHPEFRQRGIGQALISLAERKARDANAEAMTLMVGSFNQSALRLYLRLGFREVQRRPFRSFPGSDQHGDWILMIRDL